MAHNMKVGDRVVLIKVDNNGTEELNAISVLNIVSLNSFMRNLDLVENGRVFEITDVTENKIRCGEYEASVLSRDPAMNFRALADRVHYSSMAKVPLGTIVRSLYLNQAGQRLLGVDYVIAPITASIAEPVYIVTENGERVKIAEASPRGDYVKVTGYWTEISHHMSRAGGYPIVNLIGYVSSAYFVESVWDQLVERNGNREISSISELFRNGMEVKSVYMSSMGHGDYKTIAPLNADLPESYAPAGRNVKISGFNTRYRYEVDVYEELSGNIINNYFVYPDLALWKDQPSITAEYPEGSFEARVCSELKIDPFPFTDGIDYAFRESGDKLYFYCTNRRAIDLYDPISRIPGIGRIRREQEFSNVLGWNTPKYIILVHLTPENLAQLDKVKERIRKIGFLAKARDRMEEVYQTR